MISHILQSPEIEKKKVAVLIGSLQATVESLLALLELHGTRRKNWKFKRKNEIYSLPLIYKCFCLRS